jgi:MoaA/NifB/PqqE/SkfB family radical SAM enzyme
MRAFAEIGIELNNVCNLRCKHCLRDFSEPSKNLALSLIERVLREAKAYEASHVAFTGGEPTLHPQLPAILDLCDALGYSYHLCTNGSLLPRLWRRLFEGGRGTVPCQSAARRDGLTGISLSLDGATEETHDAIREPGSYRSVMQSISLCQVKGVPVTVQMIVNRKNRAELSQFALLVAQLKLRKGYYGFLQPVPMMDDLGLILTPQEMLEVKAEVERLRSVVTVPLELSVGHHVKSPLAICRTLDLSTIYIDHRGNLNFCCQLSGYLEADDSQSEVVCSLLDHTLQEAHLKLVQWVARHHQEKIARIADGSLGLADHFPCFYCARYFRKVGWLERRPGHPWGDAPPATERSEEETSRIARLELPVLTG